MESRPHCSTTRTTAGSGDLSPLVSRRDSLKRRSLRSGAVPAGTHTQLALKLGILDGHQGSVVRECHRYGKVFDDLASSLAHLEDAVPRDSVWEWVALLCTFPFRLESKLLQFPDAT